MTCSFSWFVISKASNAIAKLCILYRQHVFRERDVVLALLALALDSGGLLLLFLAIKLMFSNHLNEFKVGQESVLIIEYFHGFLLVICWIERIIARLILLGV